jgi:hypothetical protein
MKRNKFALAVLLGLATTFGTPVMAQLSMPAASPPATVTQRVGLTDITVKYSRPSTKGRKIFGETLPYGQAWRAGANNSTVIEFKDPVTLQGTKVPAGEYAIYTIPGENEWTVVFNKDTKLGGNTQNYKNDQDVARFKVKPVKTPTKTETFTINFADLTPATANLELLWENTSVKVKITTEVDSKVMTQIQEQVINGKDVKPDLYAAAAAYYLDANKDPKQALEWIKLANAKEPKFWNVHTQAKLEAKNKDYKSAVATAEKSIALAKEAKNTDYVRINEKAIAEWKAAK